MISINQERLIDEFFELVQIDSETGYETQIADVLTRKFKDLGLDVIEDDSKNKTGHGAGNLICTLKANKEGVDPIYFTSHMDTVVPGNGIKPSIRDGYIVSCGTTVLGADDKAGVAAILETVRSLKELGTERTVSKMAATPALSSAPRTVVPSETITKQ